MRICFVIIFVIGVLQSCTTTRQYTVDKRAQYLFNDNISLQVLNIKEIRQLAVGNGSYFPENGYKFFEMALEAKNIGNDPAQINWKSIFVIDTLNKVKYAPGFVMANSASNIGSAASKLLKSGQTASTRLVYSIPLNVKTRFFGINEKIEAIPHQ